MNISTFKQSVAAAIYSSEIGLAVPRESKTAFYSVMARTKRNESYELARVSLDITGETKTRSFYLLDRFLYTPSVGITEDFIEISWPTGGVIVLLDEIVEVSWRGQRCGK